MGTVLAQMSRDEIIREMLIAYYSVVYPGRTLEQIGEGGLVLTRLVMNLIYDGKEAWGKAEEAAQTRLNQIRSGAGNTH